MVRSIWLGVVLNLPKAEDSKEDSLGVKHVDELRQRRCIRSCKGVEMSWQNKDVKWRAVGEFIYLSPLIINSICDLTLPDLRAE
jgi:hypothetical protein